MYEHQKYQDLYQDARDWLHAAQDQLLACAEVRGDRTSLQAKQHKMTDMLASTSQGQAKVKAAEDAALRVLPYTSPAGQEQVKVSGQRSFVLGQGQMVSVLKTLFGRPGPGLKCTSAAALT